ncbi:MAG: AI-2E family transporter, partial [Lachnospiraceae bacterium]|nr:AI-2E family transporter [Candidatus Equihabitans merdae]
MFLVFLLFERSSALELFTKIWHVFEPIVYGLLIAYILNPIMQIFEKVLLWIVYKLKKSPSKKGRIAIRAIADFGSLFFLLYLFYALIAMIIPQLVESFQNLSRSYPIYFANITHWLEGLIANMHLDSSVAEAVNKIGVDVSDWVANKIIPSVDVIVETVTGTLVNVAVFFKNSFLGMIVAIYFLMIKERLKARFKRLNYALFSINTGNQILNNLRLVNEKFGGFIIGKVVDSIIIGIICYFCMLVLRLPYPMLISVFIGITNIIPVFGPFIGAIPSIILILGVNPMQALYFLI